MKHQSRKTLQDIVSKIDTWLHKNKYDHISSSLFISGIRDQIRLVLEGEESPVNGNITPCERVSYEKCLDRLDEEIKRLKGQVSHDAWGPMYTADQSILMKDLKESRKEILGKLGLPA